MKVINKLKWKGIGGNHETKKAVNLLWSIDDWIGLKHFVVATVVQGQS